MIFSSVYRLRFIFGPPFGQNTGKSHITHGSNYGGQVNQIHTNTTQMLPVVWFRVPSRQFDRFEMGPI